MFSVPRPGLEPGPGPSQGPMLSTTPPGSVVSIPPWSRTRTKALGEPRAIRYTSGTFLAFHCRPLRSCVVCLQHQGGSTTQPKRHPNLDSNQDPDLQRVGHRREALVGLPLHHRDTRADDWICTSMVPLTRRMPFYIEPRRHKRPRPEDRERDQTYFSSSTFQYASLKNFDQLSIR